MVSGRPVSMPLFNHSAPLPLHSLSAAHDALQFGAKTLNPLKPQRLLPNQTPDTLTYLRHSRQFILHFSAL